MVLYKIKSRAHAVGASAFTTVNPTWKDISCNIVSLHVPNLDKIETFHFKFHSKQSNICEIYLRTLNNLWYYMVKAIKDIEPHTELKT